jgi:hypothetical protein
MKHPIGPAFPYCWFRGRDGRTLVGQVARRLPWRKHVHEQQ